MHIRAADAGEKNAHKHRSGPYFGYIDILNYLGLAQLHQYGGLAYFG
jgi:hypothetical protein